jgi:hypothetical protein
MKGDGVKKWLLLIVLVVVSVNSPSMFGQPAASGDRLLDRLLFTPGLMSDGCIGPYNNVARIRYPGTNSLLVYECDLLLAAKVGDSLKTTYTYSWAGYYPGYAQRGIILPTGEPDDPSKSEYHAYRLYKGWNKLKEGSEKDGYRVDYNSWPAILGAPIDAGGDPVITGDQYAWCVINDGPSTSQRSQLGAEIQVSVWGLMDDPILKNMFFVKYTIINKSKQLWDSVYVGVYSEPMLSGLFGCDTTLGMGYYYSFNKKNSVFGQAMPATGCILLQGPLVDSPGDVGMRSGSMYLNKKNLGMTSYVTMRVLVEFSQQAHFNLLRGCLPTGSQQIDPILGKATAYFAPGDPLAKTGWNMNPLAEEYSYIMLSTGPFTLSPRDTQEVIAAYVVARGATGAESLSLLKYYSRYVKATALSNFQKPVWTKPNVNINSFSNRTVLTWDLVAEQNRLGYQFEGYHIYQGETPTGPWHKIATYDLLNDKRVLIDEVYNSDAGMFEQPIKDIMPNQGLQRFVDLTRDSIKHTVLHNGSKYYFAVTAFAVSSLLRPMIIESPIEAIEVTPQEPLAGSVLYAIGDSIAHSRLQDDAVSIKIMGPFQLKNNRYRIQFYVSNKETTWTWYDLTAGTTICVNQKNIKGQRTNPIYNGILPVVYTAPYGMRRDYQVPRGWEYVPSSNRWFNGAAAKLIMDGLNKGVVYPQLWSGFGRENALKPHDVKRIEIRFSETTKQKAYRYVDGIRSFPPDALRHASFAPYIKNRGPGFVYQDYVDVPLTVWEVDELDGDLTPRQLNVAFVERNDTLYNYKGDYVGKGNINGAWDPTTEAEGGSELLYVFGSPYGETEQARYTGNELFYNQSAFDVMYMIWIRRDSTQRADRKIWFNEGDKLVLQPNYPLADGRIFEFETKAPIIGDAALAKDEGALNKINVFPNPYYGGHGQETTFSERFISFSHLPAECTIRIYTLAGTPVRMLHHVSTTNSFERWDLKNEGLIAVASGIYIAHIEAPGIGTKILKFSIIVPERRLKGK